MQNKSDRPYLAVFFVLIGLFILGRYLGGALFDGAWSFTHWKFLPTWYGPAWILGLVALSWFFMRTALIDRILLRRWFLPVVLLLVAAVIWFCQFDSFVYGGGNLRIAQVGQSDRIFLRWFEFGALLAVKLLFGLFTSLKYESIEAAAAAWKALALVSTLLSAAASWKIASRLSPSRSTRLLLFFIVFFGPQALLMFGFMGVEPLMVCLTLWFLYYCLRTAEDRSGRNLAILWGLAVLGVVCHVGTAFLVPSAAFVTLSSSPKGLTRLGAGLAGAALVMLAGVAAVYWQTEHSLELVTWILFPAGKLPHPEYGMFSSGHLLDLLQVIFLSAPLIGLTFYLRIRGTFDPRSRVMVFASCLAQISGLIVLLMLDPRNSIPLDFPRFIVFLTPSSVLLAIGLARAQESDALRSRLVPILAAFSLVLPFATLPIYTRIDQAGPYVADYLERHDYWFRGVGLAFRDAYFGRRALGKIEYDKASKWENLLPIRSVDYINYRGSVYLSVQNDNEEALRQLYYLIAKNPYWAEPREIVAGIQMKLNQFDRAKPQIDTCLMLEPYTPSHYSTLYAWYRNQQDMQMAGTVIDEARRLFPKNKEIATDYMIYLYKTGKTEDALTLAADLLAQDNKLPFPYLIRAFVEDKSGNVQTALADYRMFLQKQENQPETLMVRQRIDQLTAGANGK